MNTTRTPDNEPDKLKALLPLFRCPTCQGALEYEPTRARCGVCDRFYPLKDNQIFFCDPSDALGSANWLDNIKRAFKKYPRLYSVIYQLLNPLLLFRKKSDILTSSLPSGSLVINVGSGPSESSPDVVNVDIIPFKNVDIVADFFSLPFLPETVDGVINEETLEHLPDSSRFFAEAERVLKKGGYLYLSVPFVCGYHGSPDDYARWTLSGLRELVRDFDVVDIGVKAGPTSGLLWVLQEWLAIALSFNVQFLYRFWYVFFLATTWPLKYLDLLLVYVKNAENIAGDLYVLCRKP